MTESIRTDSNAIGRAESSFFRALVRSIALVLVTAGYFLAFLTHRLFARSKVRRREVVMTWTLAWTKAFGRIAGLRVAPQGLPPPAGSLLCPNHLGYADILAIASVVRTFFVSRADAADWPVVGLLVRSSEQILVSRRRNRDLGGTARQISERLAARQSVCVFLEGTSTGGDRILPFLPALLQPAIDCRAPVVPVALRWSSSDPEVIVAEDIAYWKDHRFPVHFWRLMGLKGSHARIVFGRPLEPERDRKGLAGKVRQEVVRLWEGQSPSV